MWHERSCVWTFSAESKTITRRDVIVVLPTAYIVLVNYVGDGWSAIKMEKKSSDIILSAVQHPSSFFFLHLVIVWKNIIRTAEQKFIRINHDKLFYLEVVWLDRAARRIFPLEMKNQIDDNDNDEIHLKNDLFNIQVYSFMSSSSNIRLNSQKNSSSSSIVKKDIWFLYNIFRMKVLSYSFFSISPLSHDILVKKSDCFLANIEQ